MNQIIPECNVDTNMIETFVPPAKRYSHQKGCPQVAKTMIEDFGDDFALGIIDKDKIEIQYLKEFVLKKEMIGHLELWRHINPDKHHYFIKICPAIEVWILTRVKEIELNIEDYKLPKDPKALRKITKTTDSRKDQRFRDLFKAMKGSDNDVVHTLINWVTHLRQYTFATNLDLL